MAGKGAILALGGGVLTLMAVGIWLVMADPSAEPGSDAGEATAEVEVRDEGSGKSSTSKPRKRKHAKGNAALFGEVKTRKNEAAAVGQEVVLTREGSDPWTVETDDKGKFRFPDLARGGPYEVSVASPGNATVRLPGIALDRKEERDLGTLWLDAAIDVEVQVKAMDGTPVAGAEVRAFAVSQPGWGFDWSKMMAQIGESPVPVASGTSDGEGKVIFKEMASGSWTFTAAKDGFALAGKSTGQLSAKDEPKPVVIHLTTAFRLAGQVLGHDNEGISGALVMATGNNAGWNFASMPLHARVTSDESGNYTFDQLPAGDTAIWAARPGGVPAQLATVRVPGVDVYDVYLKLGGVLEGTVTEKESGEPVVGATVRAQGWSFGGSRVAEAVTDEAGKYTIDTLLEGTLNSVTVEREGWVQVHESGRMWQQIPINRGDTVVRDLVVRPAASLTGLVTGPDGPVADAKISAFVRTGAGGMNNKQATTDSTGRYRFEGLDKGTAMLQVTAEGLYQENWPQNYWQALNQGTPPEDVSAEIPESGEATKDLKVIAGVDVSGRVQTPDGGPVAGADVTAFGGAAPSRTKSGDDGTFTLSGVKPGSQVNLGASKSSDRYVGKNKQVEVHADRPNQDVVLELHPVAKVTGTVTSDRVGDLRDAYVQISSQVQPNRPNNPFNPNTNRWQNNARAPVRADGTYEIDMPFTEGKFVVRASALGHESVSSPTTEVVAGQDSYQVDVVLREGTTVSGRVLKTGSADGIAGASLTLGPQQGNNRTPQVNWSGMGNRGGVIVAISDSSGAYRIEHVAEGKYTVGAKAEGFVDGSANTTVPGSGDVNVSLEPSLTITGFVQFADGTAVEGATVQAVSAKQSSSPNFGNFGQSQVITGSDGGFRVPDMKSGSYRIKVSPPWNGAVNLRNTTSDPVSAGTEGFKVIVEPGLTIRGALVDPDDHGISGVWVSCQPEKQSPGMLWRNTQTKADGTFEIVGLTEGTYTLNVRAGWGGGKANEYQPIRRKGVSAGESDVLLRMVAGLSIEGVVVDQSGKPVVGKQLHASAVRDPDNPSRGPTANKSATTQAGGKFKISGLSPGNYKIALQGGRFNPYGMQAQNDGEVLSGGDKVGAGATGLQLTISQGASISGTVVDEFGKPLGRAWVTAQTTEGGPRNRQNAQTDENGAFKIPSLSPSGTYTITARLQRLKSSKIEDVTGGTTGLKIVLTKGVGISGRLLDAAGRPMANTNVLFGSTEKGTSKRSFARTGEDGSFEASGLEAGVTYKVTLFQTVPNADGIMTSKNSDLGEVTAPATSVELRAPAD